MLSFEQQNKLVLPGIMYLLHNEGTRYTNFFLLHALRISAELCRSIQFKFFEYSLRDNRRFNECSSESLSNELRFLHFERTQLRRLYLY